MSERDLEFLTLYRDHRFEDQRSWYEGRIAEYERAHNQVITVTGVALFGASAAGLAASANLGGLRVGWAILAAAMSGLGTLFGAYNQLLNYEENAKIYRDALGALGALRAGAPWLEDAEPTPASTEEFVAAAETVFHKEIGQWGQLTAQQTEGGQEPRSPHHP